MDKQYDFTNVADLACSLKMLNIEGSTEAFGTSNIIPNDLAFDLIGFKSLTKLVLTNVDCCPEKIQSISHVRTTLKVRKFQREIVVSLIFHKTNEKFFPNFCPKAKICTSKYCFMNTFSFPGKFC